MSLKYTSPKIFIPDTSKVIGSQQSAGKAQQNQLLQQVESVKHSYSSYQEYNAKVLAGTEVKEELKSLRIRPNNVIIQLLKYEGEYKTEGGIIIEDHEFMQTESGQIKARLNSNPFQQRGVVILVSKDMPDNEFYKSLKEGDIVHLSTNKFEPFKMNKSLRGEPVEGYFLVNVSSIDAIEN